jgi:hypothetical protein
MTASGFVGLDYCQLSPRRQQRGLGSRKEGTTQHQQPPCRNMEALRRPLLDPLGHGLDTLRPSLPEPSGTNLRAIFHSASTGRRQKPAPGEG